VAPQAPETSKARPGKKTKGHARIDKGCRRKNLERAWEKGQKPRGRAGIDDVTIAQLEARQEGYLALLHRQRREGTSRPPPGQRVEIPKSEGGGRTRGIPAVLERVGQPALGPRMEPIFEPTVLDRAFGYRRGRSPHAAMRQVGGELNQGNVWIVEADLRPFVDTSAQERRIDGSAEASSDSRVLHLGRDMRRAGVREGGGWKPTLTGVPQGGVASPLWSNIFLTPLDRQMTADGFRLTRGADDCGVRWQPREAAQRALAVAERCLREALGGARHPQKTRVVHGRQGCEFRGSKVKQGAGHRLPAHTRRSRSHPHNR
jgi:RNA-directed DNA polymerase